MVQANADLVTFRRGPINAQLVARAEADAVAQFDLRRGLRVSAEAKAEISGKLRSIIGSDPQGPAALATVDASLGAGARFALAAQLGVNGLFAEACAAAEARARVRGDIKVTGQILLDAFDVELPAGVSVPVKAFLREVGLNAGVFAEAYFAVRARASLKVLGSVIPLKRDESGSAITVAFDYGYAYIWGAGVSGYVDVDLPDADRVVAIVIDAAVAEALRLLPASTPREIESLLRFALPLAGRTAMSVGQALGSPQSDAAGAPSEIGDVAQAFLSGLSRSGLELLLKAAVDAALQQATIALDSALDQITRTDHFRQKVTEAIGEARGILDEVGEASSLREVLPVVIRLSDMLASFADDMADTNKTVMAEVASALTMATAGAALLSQILGDDPLPGFPPASANRIRARLNAPSPTLSIVHLVEYLGVEIGDLEPGFLQIPDWLADILGTSVPGLIEVLWNLDSPQADPAAGRQLAAKVVQQVVDEIVRRLRPFVNELPDGQLRQLAVFIEPLLDSIEIALLPLLTSPTNPSAEVAARARDEIDTLLLEIFGALVIRSMDTVIRPFFNQGAAQLTELADRVDRHDPAFAEFFAVANQFDVVFRITEALVSESLREMAGIIKLAERSAFDSALEIAETFVLLPAPTADRRLQLAVLAGTDNPRIGETALREQLLDALFVKSTEFAVGMIPPSIKMSTLIAIEQGPIPVVTLYQDVKAVAEASAELISDMGGVVSTVGDIIASLVERGTVTAEQLVAFGNSLKELIKDAVSVAEKVLETIKDATWPIFVASTLLVGSLFKEQFNRLFDGITQSLLEAIHAILDQLADAVVEAAIMVAQGVGVLDTGSGSDLGGLGQAVRQRTLGDPREPSVNVLGLVSFSHAELATMVTNEILDKSEVRGAIRTLHARAADQAKNADQAVLLSGQGDDIAQATAALRATLAAQQRDTGFAFDVTIGGVTEGAVTPNLSKVEVVIAGAGMEFVTGAHPLVRIEIGGWPVAIDPAAWWADDLGLHGVFTVVADPALDAPHPFISQGAVSVSPQPATPSAQFVLDGSSEALTAIQAITQAQFARNVDSRDAVLFLCRPGGTAPKAAADLTASEFLPPELVTGHEAHERRFPAILAVDRRAFADGPPGTAAFAPRELAGTSDLAFISATDLPTMALRNTSGLWAGHSISVVARARPGYTTVTASVSASPKDDQTQDTTPRGNATPTWFLLTETSATGTIPPTHHDDAGYVSQEGVPISLTRAGTAQVSITMRNTGTSTWTTAEGYKLGSQTPGGNTTWGDAWHELPHPVAPGQDVTFTFTIKAPPLPGATYQWQMVRDQPDTGTREWFGDVSEARQIGVAVNNAQFVSQNVTGSIQPGESAQVSVTMRNIGTSTWTTAQGHRLGSQSSQDNTTWGTARQDLPNSVPPGQEATFTFTIPAPPAPAAAFQWQMLQEGQEWFGERSPQTQISRGEPTECAVVRNAIGELNDEIASLQAELARGPLGSAEKAGIKKEISKRIAQLKDQQEQFDQFGCLR